MGLTYLDFPPSGVQPPDEYHTDVNNSVFTNTVAKLSLENAARLASGPQADLYQFYADHVYIPFNETHQFHPEYDGYEEGTMHFTNTPDVDDENDDIIAGTTIKQADVVLMGFPLMVDMSQEVKRNDLEIYSKVKHILSHLGDHCLM